MASGVSTPSSVHTLSRVSSPEPLLPTPETESDDNEEVIDYGQCEPTLMDLTWVRDFPRFVRVHFIIHKSLQKLLIYHLNSGERLF